VNARENAENKKMFTRLWVHETMRTFYDRLSEEAHRDALFDSVRASVKTVFRENFDSAFEHLGKIDGQVLKQLHARSHLSHIPKYIVLVFLRNTRWTCFSQKFT
jgi:dynein heavy chain